MMLVEVLVEVEVMFQLHLENQLYLHLQTIKLVKLVLVFQKLKVMYHFRGVLLQKLVSMISLLPI